MSQTLPDDVAIKYQIVFRNTNEEFKGRRRPVTTVWLETESSLPYALASFPLEGAGILEERLRSTFTEPVLRALMIHAIWSMLLLGDLTKKPSSEQERIINNHVKQWGRMMKSMLGWRKPGRPRKHDLMSIVFAIDGLIKKGERVTKENVAQALDISVTRIDQITGGKWTALVAKKKK
jgi:hypothetical protein